MDERPLRRGGPGAGDVSPGLAGPAAAPGPGGFRRLAPVHRRLRRPGMAKAEADGAADPRDPREPGVAVAAGGGARPAARPGRRGACARGPAAIGLEARPRPDLRGDREGTGTSDRDGDED